MRRARRSPPADQRRRRRHRCRRSANGRRLALDDDVANQMTQNTPFQPISRKLFPNPPRISSIQTFIIHFYRWPQLTFIRYRVANLTKFHLTFQLGVTAQFTAEPIIYHLPPIQMWIHISINWSFQSSIHGCFRSCLNLIETRPNGEQISVLVDTRKYGGKENQQLKPRNVKKIIYNATETEMQQRGGNTCVNATYMQMTCR